MGPIERFFTGLAATLGAMTAPELQLGVTPPAAVEITAPAGPVPLPAMHPERVALAATPQQFVAGATAPPPLPRPNPLDRPAEIAALPPAGFTPLPDVNAAAACRSLLSALPVEAILQPPIVEGACGITAPIEIATVGLGAFAVELTPPALVDCSVAGALTQWLEEDVQPAAHAILGEWVTGIRVAASYACRGRNNDPTAVLSEHAFGRAIDISAFRLADGTWVEVRPATEAPAAEADFLAAIRSEACGPFTTVLGPGVALHDEHFHLDLATRGADGRGLYCP